jgi:hypothetical protein
MEQRIKQKEVIFYTRCWAMFKSNVNKFKQTIFYRRLPFYYVRIQVVLWSILALLLSFSLILVLYLICFES